MAVVVRAASADGASAVVGIIGKERVADSVAARVAVYAD